MPELVRQLRTEIAILRATVIEADSAFNANGHAGCTSQIKEYPYMREEISLNRFTIEINGKKYFGHPRMVEEIVALRAENAKLREALAEYANEGHWEVKSRLHVEWDGLRAEPWRIAQAALVRGETP